MSQLNETVTEIKINQLSNEIDKQDHFIELLRDQVAELKMTIENKDRQIKDLQNTEFVATSRVVELEEQLVLSKNQHTEDLNKLTTALGRQRENIDFLRKKLKSKKVENKYLRQQILRVRYTYLDRLKDTEKFLDKAGDRLLVVESVNKVLSLFVQYLQQVLKFNQSNLYIANTVSEQRKTLNDQLAKENICIATELKQSKHLLNRETLRREDLQTATFNFMAKEKILTRKLDLAYKIINWMPLKGCSKELRRDVADFMSFDNQPENQIDTIWESLTPYAKLEE